jgi:hypothetical protein
MGVQEGAFQLQECRPGLPETNGLYGSWTEFFVHYMETILVACTDEQTHLRHHRQILERLREFGLVLNCDKFQSG